MLSTRPAWENRLDWTTSALFWVALTAGVVVTAVAGISGAEALAALLTAGYVVVMQIAPRRYRHHQTVGEILAVSGVVVSIIAIALTGGIDSPYVLFAATPTFFAASFLGFRIGIETAVLSSIGLILVVAALGQPIVDTQNLQTVLLFVLIAVTFSQARRLLVEERARSEAATQRVHRLEAANTLLNSLTELANAAELNPVTVGQAALRDLEEALPMAAGEIAMADELGVVVVARRGEPGPVEDREVFPMGVAGRNLGYLALWPSPGENFNGSRESIQAALRPLELAFDNIHLLQQIARRAVTEERTRVARELHDEIGPALASLGLALDTAINSEGLRPELARNLQQMRGHVTQLVEEVRTTVSDLRHESVTSLVQHLNRLASEFSTDGPAILVDLNERRPPRGTAATEIAAILTEVVRNAVTHSKATVINIGGYVDRKRGSVVVKDDGRGFDPSEQPKGHFGLIGIRERAREIDAELDIASELGTGTVVTLNWGS